MSETTGDTTYRIHRGRENRTVELGVVAYVAHYGCTDLLHASKDYKVATKIFVRTNGVDM